MPSASPWLPASEREPIHRPGTIQPWGALLVADQTDLIVRHASANLGDFLDVSAAQAIGQPLGALLDPAAYAEILGGAAGPHALGTHTGPAVRGTERPAFAVSGHLANDLVCLEIEPAAEEGPAETGVGHWADARAVVEALRRAPSSPALFAVAASELRRATGFDRAIVYRLDAIGHGEVVAEECAPDLEPLLGLRYPTFDVPRQARQIYLWQRVRVIADAAAAPVALLGGEAGEAMPDLSLAALRAPSPIHLEDLRNMGIQATAVISIIVDGELWGMLVCHHRAPRIVSPVTRVFCRLLGQVASLMVGTLRDAEDRAAIATHRAQVAAIAGRLGAPRPRAGGQIGSSIVSPGLGGPGSSGTGGTLAGALAGLGADLQALCAASGAVVRLGSVVTSVGSAPTGDTATALVNALLAHGSGGGEPLAITELRSLLPPELADAVPHAGALLVPLMHAAGDAIVWLRPERAEIVRWGGDPAAQMATHADAEMLLPRPFDAVWQQEVRGQSSPWTAAQLDAARALRREIDDLMARRTEAELARLRHHDPLTGLPNLRLLRENLAAWSLERPSSCVLVVGLDRQVDTAGGGPGEGREPPPLDDTILVQAAGRVAQAAGAMGLTVARIGAGRFGVFGRFVNSENTESLAATLRAALAKPFESGMRATSLTASVGIAMVTPPPPELTGEDLLTRADLAQQAASDLGGNRSLVFNSRLRSGTGRSLDIERELRAAVAGDIPRAGSFRLLYQPCVALSNGQGPAAEPAHAMPPLRGFEALLRWEHPRLGSIAPGEFIGIAEDCGLIETLGDWVLSEAIGQLAAWRERAKGLPVAIWRIAVNVSNRQLAQPGFAARIIDELARHHLPPGCLALEISERVLADTAAMAVIAALREARLPIAVDNFGAGASSLAALQRLPVDELKVDRSFLQHSGSGHDDMLAALVRLGRAAGLSMLAEGVETEAHLAAVSASGFNAAQGWLFARALPPDEAAEWIAGAHPAEPAEPARAMLPFSFQDITDTVNEGVVVTTADLDAPGPTIIYVNPAFTRMTGWKLNDIVGRSPRLLHGERTNREVLRMMGTVLRHGQQAHARVLNYARSGMPFWNDMRVSPMRGPDGSVTHFVAVTHDVTHEMRRFDELESLAERDPLTSIANRRGLERFAEAIPVQADSPLCIATINLDGFKQLNYSFGHATGDAVLLGVADLIMERVRPTDFAGRLGADEFVVCIPSARPADAVAAADRLQAAILAREFETPTGPIRISCSIGVAVYRPDDTSLDAVIARAQHARSAGRGRVMLAAAAEMMS